MKTVFKRISLVMLLLALLLLSASMISCGDSDDGIEDVGSKITLGELANYKIIYPEGGLRGAAFTAAYDLQAAIEAKIGVKIAMSDDYYAEGFSDPIGEFEILLGNTARPESVQAMEGLKARDCVVRMAGKKLVIASDSTEIVAQVIGELIERIGTLEGDDAVFYNSSEDDRRTIDEYELSDVVIDGASISEYRIVYLNDDAHESLATELRDVICERTGYMLDMMPDSKKNNDGKREIIVGLAKRSTPAAASSLSDKKFFVGESAGSIWLCGKDAYCTYQAVQDFYKRLTSSESGASLTLSIDEKVSPLVDDGSLVAMTFNVYYSNPKSRLQAVTTIIKKHMPHSFGVQEATSEWMKLLKEELKDDYMSVGVGRNKDLGGETCSIFFRKDTFSLVKSDTQWLSSTPTVAGSKVSGSSMPRIFTYAILERKSDGQRFMHVNTHLHHTGDGEDVRVEQIKHLLTFLRSYKDKMPIVLTGDLNAVSSAPSVQNLLKFGFEDSQSLAMVGDDIRAQLNAKTIDYVLLSKDDFRVLVYDVDNSTVNGVRPSDHDAIVARYMFK